MSPKRDEWDTFAFFEEAMLLFAGYMAFSCGNPADSLDSYRKGLAAAIHSYVTSGAPRSSWSEEQERVLGGYLTGDYSIEALHWYEESAEAIQLFACVVFGALLSKFNTGQIVATDYYLAEAHLPAFIIEENERICDIYQQGKPI